MGAGFLASDGSGLDAPAAPPEKIAGFGWIP
jgi:hypothetical protein